MTLAKTLRTLGTLAALGAAAIGCEEAPRVNQVLVDVNRDGRKDIVNYMFDTSGWGSHDIYVTLNSNGSFAAPRIVLRLENRITELHCEDLDGDQIPDLSYVMFDTGGWGSWDMYSAKGNGDGTFQNPIKIRHYENKPH
jgi:hypothetical protein